MNNNESLITNQIPIEQKTESHSKNSILESHNVSDKNEKDSSLNDLDCDKEEKHRILELQHTLEDLLERVESVKKENQKLRAENQILGQYIENLMETSSVFQSTSPYTSRKTRSNTSSVFEVSPNKP